MRVSFRRPSNEYEYKKLRSIIDPKSATFRAAAIAGFSTFACHKPSPSILLKSAAYSETILAIRGSLIPAVWIPTHPSIRRCKSENSRSNISSESAASTMLERSLLSMFSGCWQTSHVAAGVNSPADRRISSNIRRNSSRSAVMFGTRCFLITFSTISIVSNNRSNANTYFGGRSCSRISAKRFHELRMPGQTHAHNPGPLTAATGLAHNSCVKNIKTQYLLRINFQKKWSQG